MRRLLGVLREDAERLRRRRSESATGSASAQRPARRGPGRHRAGTRLILTGRPTRLDPGVELAAYRIVQEALTNSRRHAPGAAVDVELHFAADALRLLVRTTGRVLGPPADHAATD